MDYRITLKRDWAYRDRNRGMTTISAGNYRVPEDIDASVAELALAQGMASKIEAARTTPQRKPRAPRTKMLNGAPENKTTLV